MATQKKRAQKSQKDASVAEAGIELDAAGKLKLLQSGNGSDDEEEDMETGEIQVDFEARNAEDSDFHGMKKLLQQLFLKANVNLSELTDVLIRQNYVGSVIKQVPLSEGEEDDDDDSDDGDEVFGIISVVNLSSADKQKATAVNDVKKYLVGKCSVCEQGQQDALKALLDDSTRHQVGLFLNERFMNIPPQIALPSFESLLQEIEKAKKKGMKYDFTHFVLICKMLRMPPMELPGRKQATRAEWEKIYVNAEEEYFCEEASLTFDFCVKDEHDLDSESDDMEPWRRVIVLPAAKLQAVMKKLRKDLAQS